MGLVSLTSVISSSYFFNNSLFMWLCSGEGMALEPSLQYGYKFLEAVRYAKYLARKIRCNYDSFRKVIPRDLHVDKEFRKSNDTFNIF